MTIELLVIAGTPHLAEALNGYEGWEINSGHKLDLATRMIGSGHPPDAVYVEDTRGTIGDLWSAVNAAQSRGIPIFVGVQSVALVQQRDFEDAGIPVTTLRDAATIADWLGQQLHMHRRVGASGQKLIAVGGAKGGIGKTLLVALLAQGFQRRGLKVLVVDGDLSNSGLVPTFRLQSGFKSYLSIRDEGAAGWTPANVRNYITHHTESGIDFLLGSEETASARDLLLPQWQAFMQAVRGLHEYPVVILDTGPEFLKRPYALIAVRDGGIAVLPVPPGRKERSGAGNALRVFQSHTPDLSDRCHLLYMAPEKGVTVSVKDIAPLFAHNFPQAKVLGVLPRAPKVVSMADEDGDRYISPIDIAPHSAFSRAVHGLVESLCQTLDLTPPHPMPRSSWWQRVRGEKVALQPMQLPETSTAPMVSIHNCAGDYAQHPMEQSAMFPHPSTNGGGYANPYNAEGGSGQGYGDRLAMRRFEAELPEVQR
ncbi:MAG: AAA family ATPase [Chloroflexota bacterium]|nr:AAA family ATPase [Chloroflexota bacterium]